MVYDEGFEIKLNDVVYFAFSKYGPTANGGYESYCGETLIGWYNDLNTKQRGCYKATKLDHHHKATEQAHNGHVVQPKLIEVDDKEKEAILTKDF